MTIVEGQIETLKSIKKVLREQGISRFNSIGDINNFSTQFKSEKESVLNTVIHEIDLEIEAIQSELSSAKSQFESSLSSESTKVEIDIEYRKSRLYSFESIVSNNIISKLFRSLSIFYFKSKLSTLVKNKSKIVKRRTRKLKKELVSVSSVLETRMKNRESDISQRAAPKLDKLDSIKQVVDGLDLLIAGAIGEDLVVKEIKKLSDEFVLFNDFSVNFKPPIRNKREKDNIHSIQIDHLLVTNAGIFILETKNWSKKSIESFNLRSPVKQIMRTSHALFVTLNGKRDRKRSLLRKHHWGNKQVPIRNIIVMINQKPNEAFQYVKVKTLNELNGYITHFQPIFDKQEIARMTDLLRRIAQQ